MRELWFQGVEFKKAHFFDEVVSCIQENSSIQRAQMYHC